MQHKQTLVVGMMGDRSQPETVRQQSAGSYAAEAQSRLSIEGALAYPKAAFVHRNYFCNKG